MTALVFSILGPVVLAAAVVMFVTGAGFGLGAIAACLGGGPVGWLVLYFLWAPILALAAAWMGVGAGWLDWLSEQWHRSWERAKPLLGFPAAIAVLGLLIAIPHFEQAQASKAYAREIEARDSAATQKWREHYSTLGTDALRICEMLTDGTLTLSRDGSRLSTGESLSLIADSLKEEARINSDYWETDVMNEFAKHESFQFPTAPTSLYQLAFALETLRSDTCEPWPNWKTWRH